MIDRLRYGLPASGDRILNHLIAWMAILLVVSVLGFGGYYYWDRMPGNTGPAPAERALSNAEDAVRADPSSLNARLALADIYFGLNRFKDSAEQYQAALTLDQQNLVGLWGLGRALLGTGDADGAKPNFQQIIDISNNADIRGDLVGASYYYLGKIALTQNDADTAIDDLTKAIAIDRSDADSMQQLGAAYVAKGNFDDALAQLTKAVHFVPDFTEAYTQMALAYDGKGMKNEARYARAMELFSQGQLSKAAKELDAVTAAIPAFADGFVGLGLTREKMGQKDAATKAYQQGLALDSTSFNAQAGLARIGIAPSTDTIPAHGAEPVPAQGSSSQGGGN